MKITSLDFKNNGKIPIRFTGDGQNINPNLSIEGVPSGAKNLVLILHDPDAPAKDWVHWLVWNISPNTKLIKENSVPESAVQGINDSRQIGYDGPSPPSGTHRYFFKIFALDTLLSLREGSRREELENAMKGHVLDKAELIGLYR